MRECVHGSLDDRVTTNGAGCSPSDVVLSDGRIVLRPWTREDAQFLADASADPAIRQYNGAHDRYGQPDPSRQPPRLRRRSLSSSRPWSPSRPVAHPLESPSSSRMSRAVNRSDAAEWMTGPARTWRRSATGSWRVVEDAVCHASGRSAHRMVVRAGSSSGVLTVVAGNEASLGGFSSGLRLRRNHAVTCRLAGARRDVMWFAALPSEWPRRSPAELPGRRRLEDVAESLHASRRATCRRQRSRSDALLSVGPRRAGAASLGDLTELEQHALQGFGLTVERPPRGLDHRLTLFYDIHLHPLPSRSTTTASS